MVKTSKNTNPTRVVLLLGILLVFASITITVVSKWFTWENGAEDNPIITFVCLQVIAGVIYIFVVAKLSVSLNSKYPVMFLVIIGLLMRASMFFSTPIMEDDYYRYLWDGGVAAHGYNPYLYVPEEVLDSSEPSSIPEDLTRLAVESGIVIERINHPHLRTIYPVVSQVSFVLAHWLKPWNLTSWRLVLLAWDLIALLLLVKILKKLYIPVQLMVIYWWNPLVIKEFFNSTHMDAVVIPLVLLAILALINKDNFFALMMLVLAIGAKLWPVVLLPLMLRPILDQPIKLSLYLAIVLILVGLMFYPVYKGTLDDSSGFTAYANNWEMNDGIFMIILWLAKLVLNVLGSETIRGQQAARVVVALLLILWTAWLNRNRWESAHDLCWRVLLTVTALFLLSPTQFPWYYLWILPFLAIQPKFSLILFTVLLPLYYLRFYMAAFHEVAIFDNGIVWLEYIPVVILLIMEYYWNLRNTRPALYPWFKHMGIKQKCDLGTL